MTITRKGQTWSGTAAADLDTYLRAFAAGGYPVSLAVRPRCPCGAGDGFDVLLDDEEGAAVRVCGGCAQEVAMLDSADHLDDAELGRATCPCGGDRFDVAVGYALLDDGEVRWVSVALRCRVDGRLGVYADWKVDHLPSRHLLDSA